MDLHQAVAQSIVQGSESLDHLHLGKLRHDVASRLGFAADGLDHKADDVQAAATDVVTQLDDWWEPERGSARQQVYLVTFASVLASSAASAEVPLRTLQSVTRENIRDAILDTVGPIASAESPKGGIVKMVVFEE